MSQSIFDIEKDLQDIFEELEENGGELTPELEEKLELNGQEVTRKVKSYVGYIQKLQADQATIKAEQDRLKALSESKQKTIDNISHLVLYALDKFGNKDKKGKKYFDWGTGKVTTRKSTSIETNDNKLANISDILAVSFSNAIYTNEISQHDSIDEDALMDAITHTIYNDDASSIEVEIEDLDDVIINVTAPIKLTDLLKSDGYQMMANLGAVNKTNWKFKPSIDKKAMKVKLTDEGCTSNIAKIVTKENLSIK